MKSEKKVIDYFTSHNGREYFAAGYYANFAYIYFLNNDFKNAIKWINFIFSNNKIANAREDVTAYMRILELMIHYELKNDLLLESLVSTTNRFFRHKLVPYKLESLLLKVLQRYVSEGMSWKDEKEELQNIKNTMKKLMKDPHESRVKEGIDIELWIDAKIHRVSMMEMAEKKMIKE